MITGLYLSLTACWVVFVATRIIRTRRSKKISLEMQGDDELQRWTRVFGNLTEYAPIYFLMLYLNEVQSLPSWLIHLLGAAFIVGRLLHCDGLVRGKYAAGKNRVRGMAITFAGFAALSVGLIVHYAFAWYALFFID